MTMTEADGRKHHIGVKAGEVGRYVLLPGDPDRVERIAKRFDNPRFVAQRREYVTWSGELDGVTVSCTSTGIGCPSAAIAVEELHTIGVDTFLRVGTSGSMQSHIKPGSIGPATSYNEVRLDPETQEILVRGPNVFMGYLNLPDKTAEAIDAEG